MRRIARSMAFGAIAIAIGAGLAACSSAHQSQPTSSKTQQACEFIRGPRGADLPVHQQLLDTVTARGDHQRQRQPDRPAF
jgi:hypothetical protein